MKTNPTSRLPHISPGTSAELPFNEKRKAILVIPGGAYAFCSDREADPIAHAYLAAGFNTFVLRYSVYRTGNPVWPNPLIDASAAMKYIRDHAEEFHIDPDYIFVIGFSAGGHLAASLGTMWDNDEIESMLGFPKGYNRPTGMILAYAVLSGLEYAHRGSIDNILGDRKEDEEARKSLSLEYRVSEKTCPAFLCQRAPTPLSPYKTLCSSPRRSPTIKSPMKCISIRKAVTAPLSATRLWGATFPTSLHGCPIPFAGWRR